MYKQPAVPAVQPADIQEYAAANGFTVADNEIQDYADLINGLLQAAELIHSQVDVKPEVSYPRMPGYRPKSDENPYNAWFVKTQIQGAPSGVLLGKRVAIKDNISVSGVAMMNGSRLLDGHVCDYDATVVTRVLQAGSQSDSITECQSYVEGGTIAGKAVCENLTTDGSSFTSVTGPVHNPIDVTKSSGGSSSGCAVLVATAEVDMAIGSDTGGSILIPASWCGIVGLKPTFGLVPYTGGVPVYPPFDHLGPMARTVYDCAALLQAMAGADDFDYKQAMDIKVDNYLKQLEDGVSSMKIGLVSEGFELSDPEVQAVVRETLEHLKSHGVQLQDISIPEHKLGNKVFMAVYPIGYHSILIKNGGIAVGTGGWHDIQLSQRLQLSVRQAAQDMCFSSKMMCLAAEAMEKKDRLHAFAKGENLLPQIKKAFNKALSEYDVLIMPTTPTVAQMLPQEGASVKELASAALGMIGNTCLANMTGHPAISVPAGRTAEGLPVGLMIIGRHFDEVTVLKVARSLEKINAEFEVR